MKDPLRHALAVLQRGVDDGAIPGAVVHVRKEGEPLLRTAVGTLDGTLPARLDSRYDLASLTKPLATASTLVALAGRGELLLSASIADFLGPSAESHRAVTVRHLLTHTSGLPSWMACYENGTGLDSAVDAILRRPALVPEQQYEYSCLGYILLAKIVEVVAGEPLDRVADRLVFQKYGLKSLGFRPGPAADIAPTISREGNDPALPVRLHGVVHDGNARAIEAAGRSVSGNAGLFGNVDDVALFGDLCLGRPGRKGRRWSGPVRYQFLHESSRPFGHTLAFFAYSNPLVPRGDLFTDQTVGHSGYTGTALLIDWMNDTTVAVLTNAVYGDGKERWLAVRRRFMNAVAAGI